MKNLLFISLISLLISCNNTQKTQTISVNYPTDIDNYFNSNWADTTFWDDGLAEVNKYVASRTIYGKERNFEYVLIAVSEDFNKEFSVKTDDYSREDLYKVIKLNAFASIPTDNYPYHFLTSTFVDRNNSLSVIKLTQSSQEWCGNTTKEFSPSDTSMQLTYTSYWDGEGAGIKKISNGFLFEDQLHYTLRSLKFTEGLTFNTQILENQVSSKIGKLVKYNATITVSSSQIMDASLIDYETWLVEVQLDGNKTNTYHFDTKFPHTLIQQKTWDNRNLLLKTADRYAYWNN